MYVKSIHFQNLKAFDTLDFDLERPDDAPQGPFAGWTVFVGGNASGKSTLLKAVALALMGPDAGRQLLGDAAGWIRKDETKASAEVEIQTDNEFDTFRRKGRPPRFFKAGVRWNRAKDEEIPKFLAVDRRNSKGGRIQHAEGGPWEPNAPGWFAAGYGPMRRLSGGSAESMRHAVSPGVVSRHVTLFREDAALSESEEWLRRVHARSLESKEPQWQRLLEGVKSLLGDGLLPHGLHVSRLTVDRVFLRDQRGLELPMRDISDGCRGVYATVLDLVHAMFEVYGADKLFANGPEGRTVVAPPGVVLIDEVEAHLHPSWQRELPVWLKRHFPRVQFLVSTHSPLIAQEADPNGVFLLPLQNEIGRAPRPLTDQEYERVRFGSAHKTVLGVAFGLSTTRGQWANQKIAQWQKLEAKQRAGAKLTASEEKARSELRRQMALAFESEPPPQDETHAPIAP